MNICLWPKSDKINLVYINLKQMMEMLIVLLHKFHWQGLIDTIGTDHYMKIARMRPALQSVYDDLLGA